MAATLADTAHQEGIRMRTRGHSSSDEHDGRRQRAQRLRNARLRNGGEKPQRRNVTETAARTAVMNG
ncbi:hypothetical protein MRX96_011995 [Rhipicephalus microplus]